MTAPQLSIKDLRRVVIAAAVGNVIEWYDFYIFGSLAAILSVQFFSKTDPVAAFLSTVAIFSVGFLIRPLGAFVFGRIGDLVGRKYTFLITLSGMGLSTALIGVVPSYARIGLTAAILLFILRLIQGLCLGGEYGGAITYVAEHVPDAKRGYYTGWLQTSPTLGIVVSLVVIIVTREALGPTRSTPGDGASRSCCRSSWSRSPSTSGSGSRRRPSSRPSRRRRRRRPIRGVRPS